MNKYCTTSLPVAGLILWFLLLAAGCSIPATRQPPRALATPAFPSASPGHSPSPIQPVLATRTAWLAVATRTLPSTPTPSSTRVTPTATSTPVPSLAYHLENRCVQIAHTTLPAALSGMVAIEVIEDNHIFGYLWNLQTGKRISLGNTIDEFVSPDGSKLAYSDVGLKAVVITDATGHRLRVIPDSDYRLSPSGWLDNQRLLLNYRRGEPDKVYILPSLIVLNVTSGERQEWLPEEYPNINDHIHEVNWRISSRLVLHPALTHLIYPAWEDSLPVILWDIRAGREVARIYNGDRLTAPSWSPDGSQFVISARPRMDSYINAHDDLPYVGGNDLFLVNRAGEIRRLTFFTTAESTEQFSYTWSPDGRWIAFKLRKGGAGQVYSGQWTMVNVETGDVVDYCISGEFVWSPDAKYILITQTDDKDIQSHVILVDLQSGAAWQIAENASAMGWMVAP